MMQYPLSFLPRSIPNTTQFPMSTYAPSFRKFGTREDAGRALARRLARFTACHDTVVLALPKGGISVGVEIARHLELPFDVLLMVRIKAPGCGETPLGAITSGGVRILNCALIDRLQLSDEEVREAVLRESIHLARRERAYRCERPSLEVADRNVILVDDGASGCTTIRDAIHLLRRQHAEHVLVAMPAACHHSACEMRLEADEVVTLAEPSAEMPVSRWFETCPTPSDGEIRRLLRTAPFAEEIAN